MIAAQLERLLVAVVTGCLLLACESGPAQRQAPSDSAADAGPSASEIEWPSFCERSDQDAVRDVFCADAAPELRSLSDLQKLLHVSPTSDDPDLPYVGAPMPDNPYAALGRIAVIGHSTSLSGQLVSPINPRVLTLGSKTVVAFARGVQRVELISTSRVTSRFNFYVVSFEQACNANEHGCNHGDLFTERVESEWTRVRVEDGEQLKNTPLDCRVCHQRTGDKPQLLMRELESPWTHFFAPTELPPGGRLPGVSGSDLMHDYLAAKGDEIYGGFDLATITPVAPFLMQTKVGVKQPLFFDSSVILYERYPQGSDAEAPQASATWDEAYEAFKRGEQLALPYYDQRATDPTKQAELTEAYRRYREGELDADELPDLADIYPEDPALRARMGLQNEPDASAEDALIQACGSCHNDVLDQSISRARFTIDVSRLDRRQLDSALDRIKRDPAEPGAMPPPEARQLDAAARERLTEFLRRDHDEVDPRLERAAKLGMAGGEVTREVLF